jgi:hypothetical protein
VQAGDLGRVGLACASPTRWAELRCRAALRWTLHALPVIDWCLPGALAGAATRGCDTTAAGRVRGTAKRDGSTDARGAGRATRGDCAASAEFRC